MSYIVVEGLDFSGKSTLVEKLGNIYKSRLVTEPFSESRISSQLRKLIRGSKLESVYETQLLIASRIELFDKLGHYAKHNSSAYLISDRSFISNAVYQSKTVSEVDLILNLNIKILAKYGYDIIPDIIFYIDIPYEIVNDRYQKNNREELNDLDRKVVNINNYGLMRNKYNRALDLIKKKYPKCNIIYLNEKQVNELDLICHFIDSHMRDIDSIPVKKK